MTEYSMIVIRKYVPGDRNFILSTWLKGNYYGSPYFGVVPQDVYFREYAKYILQVLDNPKVEIRIACDRSSQPWVVGFSVHQGESLYWVHVKRDFRGQGIAKLLLEGVSLTTVKGLTRIGRSIAYNKGLIFNPF